MHESGMFCHLQDVNLARNEQGNIHEHAINNQMTGEQEKEAKRDGKGQSRRHKIGWSLFNPTKGSIARNPTETIFHLNKGKELSI